MTNAQFLEAVLLGASGLISSAVLAGVEPGISFTEPQRRIDAFCSARFAVGPMPALDAMVRQTDPDVLIEGKLVKGMYYSEAAEGANDLVAFRLACDRLLESRPFLIFDFRTSKYSLDTNRDGCAEEVGRLPHPEVDPVPFLNRLPDASGYCYEDRPAA